VNVVKVQEVEANSRGVLGEKEKHNASMQLSVPLALLEAVLEMISVFSLMYPRYIYCNGPTLLKNFDIFREAGSGPLLKSFQHIEATAQGKIEGSSRLRRISKRHLT
jgi:hypothetical protein